MLSLDEFKQFEISDNHDLFQIKGGKYWTRRNSNDGTTGYDEINQYNEVISTTMERDCHGAAMGG